MKKFLLIIILFFSFTTLVHASDVSVVSPEVSVVGKRFSVFVNIDTGGVIVNSFDISVSYPDFATFEGYKEEGSIRKLWLEAPNAKGKVINMKGVIPNGVDGLYDPDKKGLQPIPVIELLFYSSNTGIGEFKIARSIVLQNDGRGTALVHDVNNSSISIKEDDRPTESKIDVKGYDTLPPNPFDIIYIPAGFFSKTPSMIVFYTTDEQSGVEKYQVRTATIWHDVTSPYQVSKTLLKRYIMVRAVDFSGNTKVASIEIPGLISFAQFILVILIISVGYIVIRKIRRKK